MQEMRPGICYNMKIGDSATLTDTRDNSTYTIAKLSDGKCWMTQNLRISQETLVATGHSITLTSADTDVNVDYPLPASGAWVSIDDAAQGIIAAIDDGYGAYYTWCAATAGCKTTDETNSGENEQAASSICPKGWRLPTGGNDGEYQALYNKYTTATWTTNNSKNGRWLGAADAISGGTFFPAAGFVWHGESSPIYTGPGGYYWSGTATSETGASHLTFGSNNISPATTNNRYQGLSIRCIAESWPSKNIDIIAVVVPPVISIDATSGMNKEVDPNLVTKGEISATISANTTYAVQLSANKTSLTNPNNSDEPTSANSIPASSNVQAKTNAWGILDQNGAYSAITTTPTNYYNTEEYNEESQSTKHTFGIGVSISPTLPAGEYSTTVTITAVNN